MSIASIHPAQALHLFVQGFLGRNWTHPLRFPPLPGLFYQGLSPPGCPLDSCLTASRGFAEVLTSVGSASTPSGVLKTWGFTLGLGFTSHCCFFLCRCSLPQELQPSRLPLFLLLEKQLRDIHLKLSLLCFMPPTFWFCQKLVAGFMIFENRSLTKEGNAFAFLDLSFGAGPVRPEAR